jgi:hypothetical protein
VPTLFAQSIGEYGGLGALTSLVQQVTYSVSVWFGSFTTTTWIVVAVGVLGLAIFLRR